MASGYLALVLHAHLPFVRHPEHAHFLEEEWLFEAITETYIPLLRMMERLRDDAIPFKLTMSLTPTLCAMLQDALLRDRYVEHVDLLIDLMQRECDRTRDDAQLLALAKFYCELFTSSRRFFVEEWNCDLIAAFRAARETGSLEIIASAATHGVLPLHSPESQRAQVLIGRDVYVDLFGAEPCGFWLPECAYEPGVENILQEANIRWFVLDSHGLMFANPRPRPALRRPARRRSRAIAIPAGKYGARPRVTRAIRRIASSTATSAGSFRWSISVRLRAACENFRA
jgi:1,4-alpha-glucan branching enzyme